MKFNFENNLSSIYKYNQFRNSEYIDLKLDNYQNIFDTLNKNTNKNKFNKFQCFNKSCNNIFTKLQTCNICCNNYCNKCKNNCACN